VNRMFLSSLMRLMSILLATLGVVAVLVAASPSSASAQSRQVNAHVAQATTPLHPNPYGKGEEPKHTDPYGKGEFNKEAARGALRLHHSGAKVVLRS
jgi:hypothetical protein